MAAGIEYKLRLSGATEFVQAMGTMRGQLPKALSAAFDAGADVVIQAARPQIPSRSGRARQSLEARSTTAGVRISAGGSRAPYYPWLDYGGRVGRGQATKRKFIKEGRYIWPTFQERRPQVLQAVVDEIRRLATAAGLEVTGG